MTVCVPDSGHAPRRLSGNSIRKAGGRKRNHCKKFDFEMTSSASASRAAREREKPAKTTRRRHGPGRASARLRTVFFLLSLAVTMAGAPAHAATREEPFPVFYDDGRAFQRAIARAQSAAPFQARVTGITLPHHLLAMDLIAGGLALLRTRQYERIVLLSPDHFRRGDTPCSVPVRDFSTCFGLVRTDTKGVEALLQSPVVSASNLFSHEHGVQAILPFLAHYFPDVPVLPVAIGISSKQKDWDALADALRPLLTDKTLLVQSTDFSHYLPWEEAARHDSETFRVLASGNPERVADLHQPRHLDSRAAQYLQLKLQQEAYNARPTVVANANSGEYPPAGEPALAETTSYIVQVYSAEHLPASALPGARAIAGRYCFAGDFFTGRHARRHLEHTEKRRRLAQKIRELTAGAPLIVNFEGVLAPECPPLFPEMDESRLPPPKWRLCMRRELTLDLLKELNVIAASLANNHSSDYGPAAYASTKKALSENGITVLERDSLAEFNGFAVAAVTDVDNSHARRCFLLGERNLRHVRSTSGDKPLFAFVHWGREGHPAPGQRERHLASLLEARGVSLIIGHHPHQSGKLESGASGTIAWSLGNFFFDQPGARANGALLEVTFFPQGTFWVRQIPVGNLYSSIAKGDSTSR